MSLSAQWKLRPFFFPAAEGWLARYWLWFLDKLLLIDYHILFSPFDYNSLRIRLILVLIGLILVIFTYFHLLTQFHMPLEGKLEEGKDLPLVDSLTLCTWRAHYECLLKEIICMLQRGLLQS